MEVRRTKYLLSQTSLHLEWLHGYHTVGVWLTSFPPSTSLSTDAWSYGSHIATMSSESIEIKSKYSDQGQKKIERAWGILWCHLACVPAVVFYLQMSCYLGEMSIPFKKLVVRVSEFSAKNMPHRNSCVQKFVYNDMLSVIIKVKKWEKKLTSNKKKLVFEIMKPNNQLLKTKS